MPSSLVLILWPASIIFTAALCFRVGMWWKGIHVHGRHELIPRRRHSDDAGLNREPDDYCGDDGSEADTAPIKPPPARVKPVRWWSDGDDTEVLPRLQDVRPPSRATPIRRPPWLR